MYRRPDHTTVHLFTLRLWREELGNGEREWRGEVKDVASGEQHYFREWATMALIVRGLCAEFELSEPPHDAE